jgi:hypothetical protein
MRTIEIVTPEMRATCREAHDALIETMDERDRALADGDRLRDALAIALPALARHSEDRLCAMIRTAMEDCRENALAICGPVLIVDNDVNL